MPGGQWTFGPRGNLGDRARAAPAVGGGRTARLPGLPRRADGSADFGSLLGGSLDASAHRLDAWITALATRRLGQLRAAQPAQVYVGGFGWVENLVARDPLPTASVPGEPEALQDPANVGYQLAPSLQQATTAAVLRSGYLTNNPSAGSGQTTASAPPPGNPFAVDLSSRRARLATWLLDGVRQGQPLADLLGYRFERELQETPGLGTLIEPFRQAFPYNPVITAAANGSAGVPTESAPAIGVTDGVALYQPGAVGGTGQQPASLPSPLTAADWTQAQPALAVLADAIDAVADAMTAQSLHEALTGNTSRGRRDPGQRGERCRAAALAVVPEHAPRRQSRSPTGSSSRCRPASRVPPPGWPATPRGAAEPALTSWLASLLGDPSQVTATVTLTDATGAPLPGAPVLITLASLGLGPLDLVALAAWPAELENLAVHTVLAAGMPAARPRRGNAEYQPSRRGPAAGCRARNRRPRRGRSSARAGPPTPATSGRPATVTDPGDRSVRPRRAGKRERRRAPRRGRRTGRRRGGAGRRPARGSRTWAGDRPLEPALPRAPIRQRSPRRW